MLEYIIRRKWYLQKHLDAPLLKEREEYLTLMYKKGLSHSYLLSIADYLLLIVQELRLTDDENRMVSIQEISKCRMLGTYNQEPSDETSFFS